MIMVLCFKDFYAEVFFCVHCFDVHFLCLVPVSLVALPASFVSVVTILCYHVYSLPTPVSSCLYGLQCFSSLLSGLM